MGCCLTTAAAAAAAVEDDTKIQSKTRDTSPPGSGEETVKEVLSETPVTSRKLQPATKTTGGNTPSFQMTKNPAQETASEVSSEIYTYSYSAGLSAATTTTIGTGTEVDEDGEVTQKLNKPPMRIVKLHRQPTTRSVERARRKERGGRPPSPAPARKPVVRSMDKNPRMTSRTVTPAQRNRNVVSSNVVRRELPVQRSRSPALRGKAGPLQKVEEKSSVKNSGKRVLVKAWENEVNVKLKMTNDVDVDVMPVPVPMPETETCESLDNPLVSLECFIFL